MKAKPKPAAQKTRLVRVTANLDAEMQRKFAEIRKRIAGSDSAVIGTCINTQHAQFKKEWPDDFS